MRAHAFATGQSLAELAGEIIDAKTVVVGDDGMSANSTDSGGTDMISQTQLLEVLRRGDRLRLVDDFDLVDFLHTLTGNAATVSDATSAGLVLTDHQDRVRYMASSNEESKMLELFQIQNDDGPCLDAITSGRPVVNADLGNAGERWPIFAPAARAAGFQSVHAFPLNMRTSDHRGPEHLRP